MPGKTCRSQLRTRAHASPLSRSWTGMGPPGTWQRGFQGFSTPAQSLACSMQQMDHRGGENRDLLCLTYLGTSKLSPLAAAPFYILISAVGEFQFLHILTSPSSSSSFFFSKLQPSPVGVKQHHPTLSITCFMTLTLQALRSLMGIKD